MKYLETEFIVMFSIGLFQWLLAITLVFFTFSMLVALCGKLWNVLFPIDPLDENVLNAEDMLQKIKERA